MKRIDLAIVIPTLNEEKYIGRLLDSISSQTAIPKELVVVDAKSKDKTREVVLSRLDKIPYLKLFSIKKYTVARQRNYGVAHTTSENILFLDADTILDNKSTLERIYKKIKQVNPNAAVIINTPDNDNWKDAVYLKGWEWLCKISKFVWPTATATSLFVKRAVFKKLGGFREELKIVEDQDFVQRIIKKNFSYIIIDNPKIKISTRRLQKEGHINFFSKSVKTTVHILRYGYKDIPTEYKFGDF